MEIYKTLTKKYLKNRLDFFKKHKYPAIEFIPRKSKKFNGINVLIDEYFNFSSKSKKWLHDEVASNALNAEDLHNWLSNVETSLIKLKERSFFEIIVLSTMSASILLLIKADTPHILTLLLIIATLGVFSYWRVNTMRIQSSLNELSIYLEQEIELIT
jgi:hypothetical protein